MRTEFEFINYIKKKHDLGHIGDDCAVLPKDKRTDIVITADLLIEDIDFRLDWTKPDLLGHKSLAISLSDIAAMGAEPSWAMLSIGVPENLWKGDFLDKFYEGWNKLAGEFNVELIGGDISKTPDKLVIDSVVLGEAPRGRSVLRSGAKAGDAVYVSGPLGAAIGGLKLLENGVRYSALAKSDHKELILAQLFPQPRVAEGIRLREQNIATAMIDISDGLSSEIHHLCEASNAGARIYADKIPVHPKLKAVLSNSPNILETALNGGEDFELLFTVNEKKFTPKQLTRFERIGEITANIGIVELIVNEETTIIELKGYRHF